MRREIAKTGSVLPFPTQSSPVLNSMFHCVKRFYKSDHNQQAGPSAGLPRLEVIPLPAWHSTHSTHHSVGQAPFLFAREAWGQSAFLD